MTKTEFETLLDKNTHLTSDNFPFPDKTYVFRNNSNEIKVMYPGDIVFNFDFNLYKNYIFRKVKKVYKNFYHIHES